VLRHFDLNLLIQFEALISEAHVSRAAEKVFLSQSAMSHALNRLREHLNDPLLVRTTQGLKPTDRALALLPQVRETLLTVERYLTPPEPFDPAKSQRLFRLACTDFFEAVTLPKLLEYLQSVAPGITIEVEMIGEYASMERLERGLVDMVVGMDTRHPIPNGLTLTRWQQQKLVCLAATNHKTVKQTLSMGAYLRLKHVVFSDLTIDSSSTVDEWLLEQGQTRQHIARTMDYIAAASIVARTDAIMTLPEEMAKQFSDMLPVKVVTPPKGIPALEMGIISHPLYEHDPAIRWLKSVLVAAH